MPQTQDSESKISVIPVDLIREIVLPYEYQKPQNGFDSASAKDAMKPRDDAREEAASDRD